MEEGKQTLSELIIGTILCVFILAVIGVFIAENKLSYILGILIGGVVGLLMCVSIYRSLNKSLEMETGAAVGYTNRKALLRFLLMAAAVVISIIASKYVSFVGVVVGILCLKLSAYLQPLTHKFYMSKMNKGR